MFQRGHKLAPGGARPGSGRKKWEDHAVEERAEQLALKFIEAHIKPVLATYGKVAKGYYKVIKEKDPRTGKVIRTTREFVYDAKVLCHYIERLVPAARQGLDLTIGTPEQFWQAIEKEKADRAKAVNPGDQGLLPEPNVEGTDTKQ